MRARLLSMLCILSTFAPAVAFAEAARPLDGDRKIEAAELGVDAVSARAFVDVRLARRFATGKEVRAASERVSLSLPEVTYDASAKAIVLVETGRRIRCASVDGDEVKDTGACHIVATIEPRAVEVGGRIVVRDHVVARVLPR